MIITAESKNPWSIVERSNANTITWRCCDCSCWFYRCLWVYRLV